MAKLIRAAALAAILAFASSLAAQERSPDRSNPAVFAEIDSILDELSRITGFQKKKPVRTATMTREGLKRFLEKRISDVIDPKEIRAEEIALKKFGFLPEDFDLKSNTVDLMTEQAAAFYDYREKRLYLLEGGSKEFEQPALVHELAHALADQHFNLKKFVDPGRSDDSVLARMAVVEGQATWLMSEYMARTLGQSIAESPQALDIMSRAAEQMSAQFPVLSKVPLYLRETLLFPYGKGLLFQQAVVENLKHEAFAEVFRNPPVSTQQVLHPGRYFAQIRPTSPPLPAFTKPKGLRLLNEGAVGELDHSVLIRQYVGRDEADRIAPHLKGSSFRLFESRDGNAFTLLYSSEWDEPSIAEEYFRLYRRVLEGKWKSFTITGEDATRVTGRGDAGGFELTLEGTRVSSIEGLP